MQSSYEMYARQLLTYPGQSGGFCAFGQRAVLKKNQKKNTTRSKMFGARFASRHVQDATIHPNIFWDVAFAR